MDASAWIEKAERFNMNTYNRFPVVFSEARGTKLWDVAGKEYTDFLSGIGVLNLGHCPEEVIKAFCDQASRLGHISNLFYNKPQIELSEKLSSTIGGRCFFANSGAEANEGAIKLARRWGKTKFVPEKTEIITALKSFHGRTLATLAATGQPEKNELFAPLTPGFKHVAFNDIEAILAAINNKTCAVMLEVVQGESGVWPAADEYLREIRRLCDERGALLIFDEVQTGIGRTGKLFAWQHYDVKPDIFTLAKGLASGFPIGAVIASFEIADVFSPGQHGSTFGAGPAVCAAALATLQTLEKKDLSARAASLGRYFSDRLRTLGADTGQITDVRGMGLMIGITLSRPIARQVVKALLDKGLIIINVDDRLLRFLPPLIVDETEIDMLIGALGTVLEAIND
ncbi:MAG TPA: aspartate aminotransferase family protein [Actinobacteria bacterium]|nr:aspartate aminotransferase family protein [Actinomycetota bacterium]